MRFNPANTCALNTISRHSHLPPQSSLHPLLIKRSKIENISKRLPREHHRGSQAGNVLVILAVDVGVDRVLAGRDLLGQVDRLDDGDVALLDRALEVDVLDLLAQVRRRADQPDVPVLDLEVDVGAVDDGLLDLALGFDREGVASAWILESVLCFVLKMCLGLFCE